MGGAAGQPCTANRQLNGSKQCSTAVGCIGSCERTPNAEPALTLRVFPHYAVTPHDSPTLSKQRLFVVVHKARRWGAAAVPVALVAVAQHVSAWGTCEKSSLTELRERPWLDGPWLHSMWAGLLLMSGPHHASSPQTVTQDMLVRLFRRYTGMEYCDLKRDPATGRSKVRRPRFAGLALRRRRIPAARSVEDAIHSEASRSSPPCLGASATPVQAGRMAAGP